MNIIIIGAGPSGMMCAIKAKNGNNNVTIIEKMIKLEKNFFLQEVEDVIMQMKLLIVIVILLKTLI